MSACLAVIGLVTSVDRLGTVVTGPFVGRWADRAGRRRPYLIGVGITAIASILGGVALGIFDLAAYRIHLRDRHRHAHRGGHVLRE
jgi:MFS family permease